jgi:hypothetical protein
MSETYYRVYPSDEVAAQMQSSACVSTSPRYNLDETEAILRFTEPVDGYITHTEAFELVQTPAWQEEPLQ